MRHYHHDFSIQIREEVASLLHIILYLFFLQSRCFHDLRGIFDTKMFQREAGIKK